MYASTYACLPGGGGGGGGGGSSRSSGPERSLLGLATGDSCSLGDPSSSGEKVGDTIPTLPGDRCGELVSDVADTGADAVVGVLCIVTVNGFVTGTVLGEAPILAA